jgi:hypothetical protein
MASLARRPRTVNPARPETALLLSINGTPYTVERLDPDKVLALVAYRLTKPDGELYDVALTPTFGPECSCPDYIFNRADKDPADLGKCKHIVALQDWGLLRAPEKPRPPVVPMPRPAPRPAAAELEEVLAGAPAAEPMTPEGVAEMADWFLADEAQRSARCPVCHGRKEDDMGGWCVGCGGIGVVPQ